MRRPGQQNYNICTRLKPTEIRSLKRYCRERGVSVAGLVVELIRAAINPITPAI
jgi:hypothetical protein